jgi:hypothetical protein
LESSAKEFPFCLFFRVIEVAEDWIGGKKQREKQNAKK